MNKYIPYEHPTYEADETEREKMMFYNPFQFAILESGIETLKDHKNYADLKTVVILSSN